MHGFADVSERAYAAVIYLKSRKDEKSTTTLVMTKTRVAPLKQISLPRLELCAATLLTRFVSHVVGVLELGSSATHL